MPHCIDIIDITPRFLSFHTRATAGSLDPDSRWALWEEAYGFAAVPPTPAGRQMGHQLLDAAWDRYPGAMPEIQAGAAGLTPAPIAALRQVAALLECDTAINMRIIAFVGGFEGNPFVFDLNGVTTLALPVEQPPDQRSLHMPHEMTHVVHAANAGMQMTWERSVVRLVLEEGLAQRATERLVPGRTGQDYTNEAEPGWFAACLAQKTAILTDVLADLDDSSSEAVSRYTVAPGPGGLTRTAYYAGWQTVGALTRAGWSLAGLSKLTEGKITEVIRTGINLALKESSTG